MADLDFVVKNGLVVNTSFTANSTRIALGSNVSINTSALSVGNTISNTRILQTSINVGNTTVNVSVNSTSFSGIANNTSFVGSTSAANVVSNTQLSANLANYVNTVNLSANLTNYQTTAGLSANVAKLTANNTSFVGSTSAANVVSNTQLSANLANYQTTAGLSANVAKLTANNTSFVGTTTAANVVSNTQLSANLANYQTTAGLSANVATLTSNNATNLNGQPASFYTNATNLTTGTLLYSVIPSNIINTTANFTRTGVTTFNGNTTFNANISLGSVGLSANGGFGTSGQVLHSNGTAAYWAVDDQGVTSVASGNGLTGGPITATGTLAVGAGNGITVNATAVAINSNTGIIANATGVYVNATYIGTLSANNTSFVGSTSAANVVSNTQLSSNLLNYAALSGANFTGPVSIAANVTITGNLVVTGSLVSMNVATLDVTDKNITIAKGSVDAASTDGAGLFVDVSGASMRYTFSTNTWEYNIGLMPSANNSYDLGLAGLRWNNVYANNLFGNGASITSVNAATVGGNTAATLRSYTDTAYSNSVTFAANATNLTNGTIPYARIPANVVNTTAAFTRTGITTFSANIVLGTSGVSANGGFGTAGQVLHSNGTAVYWDVDDQGVTSVASGNGLTGGPITGTGTLAVGAGNGISVNATAVAVLANTGVVANATGVYVNATYIGTISANNSSFLGGVAAANYARSDSADTLTGLITINGTGLNGGIKLQNATGGRDWRVLQKDDGYFHITDETINTSRFQIEGTNNPAGSTFALGNFNFNVYGDVTAFYSSDERLKNNVVVISNALEKVKQIRGVEFDWSDEYIETRSHIDKYFVKKHDVGVIAQEIEKVLPEVVSEREDGIKAVKYDRIVALLIEAVKELSAEIEKMKKE
jgi:hypothetical protein